MRQFTMLARIDAVQPRSHDGNGRQSLVTMRRSLQRTLMCSAIHAERKP